MFSKRYPQTFKKQHNSRKQSKNQTNYQYSYSVARATTPIYFYAEQRVLLPNRFIAYFRKILKKYCKKKQIKCWINLQLNKVISSKSKNSRMGKGVGTINRTGFYVNPQKPLFVFKNISHKRACLLASDLTKRCNIKITAKYN